MEFEKMLNFKFGTSWTFQILTGPLRLMTVFYDWFKINKLEISRFDLN